MISLTTLKGESFVLNVDKILCVEQQADTIVRCVTGNAYRVKESAEDIIYKVLQFNRDIVGYRFSRDEGEWTLNESEQS